MSKGSKKRAGVPDLRQRLLALGGLVVIVGVAVVVLLAAGVLGNQGGGEGIQNAVVLEPPPVPARLDLEVSPQVGKLAPDFELSDFGGDRHRLSEFRGKVVYLNFWATWCVPCQVELSDMFELMQRHEDELVIITVNRAEPVGRAQSFFENLPNSEGGNGVSFTVNGLDPDDTLYDKYRGLGMPVSVFINADGVVTFVHNGLLRLPQMEEAFAAAVRSTGGSVTEGLDSN